MTAAPQPCERHQPARDTVDDGSGLARCRNCDSWFTSGGPVDGAGGNRLRVITGNDDVPLPDEPPPGPWEDDPTPELLFERDVAKKIYQRRVDDEARRRMHAETTREVPTPQLLADFLEVDDPPVAYRINDLLPVGGRALLAAQFKAGKSTLIANLLRSLADGDEFLGAHRIDPPAGRIVLLDDELDGRMLRRWLRDQSITRTDRVAVQPLRGRLSSFDILDEEVRAMWASKLRELDASVVIFDCLRPVLDALGLDEDKEAGKFLVAFDELLGAAGVDEAVVVHHMGHTGERSRGSSRLRDWPDVEWRLVRKDADDPSSPRFFTAYGRDVDQPERELVFNTMNRRLAIVGGSRRDSAVEALIPSVLEVLGDEPGLSGRAVEDRLADAGTRAAVRAALKSAIEHGDVRTRPGPRRSLLHELAAGVDSSAPSGFES